MSNKQIDVYRTGIYLRLSQGDEDIDGLEKKESNSISNQKLLREGFIDAHDDLKLVDICIDDSLLEDKDSLQILLISAINDAIKLANDEKQNAAASLFGGFGGFGGVN